MPIYKIEFVVELPEDQYYKLEQHSTKLRHEWPADLLLTSAGIIRTSILDDDLRDFLKWLLSNKDSWPLYRLIDDYVKKHSIKHLSQFKKHLEQLNPFWMHKGVGKKYNKELIDILEQRYPGYFNIPEFQRPSL